MRKTSRRTRTLTSDTSSKGRIIKAVGEDQAAICRTVGRTFDRRRNGDTGIGATNHIDPEIG